MVNWDIFHNIRNYQKILLKTFDKVDWEYISQVSKLSPNTGKI
jgi:hypothetical protein